MCWHCVHTAKMATAIWTRTFCADLSATPKSLWTDSTSPDVRRSMASAGVSAGRGTAEVLRADEIRAKRVLLFSCTNFSVAGDLYPSNVSLIVSALEGVRGQRVVM